MASTGGNQRSNPPGRSGASELTGRRSAFHFVVVLALSMLVFNLVVYRGLSSGGWWDSYLRINAQAAAMLLSFLGYPVTATGATLNSPQFPMSIATGCDAVQASAFFLFAMLLSPVAVPRKNRALAVLCGLVVLAAMNIVRIVSLYLIGVYYVKAFDFAHGELWQLIFILLPLALWLAWLRKATRRTNGGDDVAG